MVQRIQPSIASLIAPMDQLIGGFEALKVKISAGKKISKKWMIIPIFEVNNSLEVNPQFNSNKGHVLNNPQSFQPKDFLTLFLTQRFFNTVFSTHGFFNTVF